MGQVPDYHREYFDDAELIPTWHLLRLLQDLKVGSFRAEFIEHWTSYTLTIQYRDE